MTILRSLCLTALVVGGFVFAAGADQAEAGRHFRGGHRGHRHFGGHHRGSHHGYRHFRHRGYGYGYGYGYRDRSSYVPRYDVPVSYQWCDIHDCYYYIDTYGARHYVR